jgi:protein CpxP
VQADAQKHHQKKYDKKNHHHSKRMMKKMARYLGLSDVQKSQIKAIKAQGREQQELLRVELKQFKEAEKALINIDIETLDEEAYIALYASYQETFAQVALAKAKTKNALFNVLTTEQQEKWLSKMEGRKGKMKGKGKNKSKEDRKEKANKD